MRADIWKELGLKEKAIFALEYFCKNATAPKAHLNALLYEKSITPLMGPFYCSGYYDAHFAAAALYRRPFY